MKRSSTGASRSTPARVLGFFVISCFVAVMVFGYLPQKAVELSKLLPEPPPDIVRIDNVQRVLVHHWANYSLIVPAADKGFQLQYLRTAKGENDRFVYDVHPGEPRWVLIKNNNDSRSRQAEFHLRAADDVGGAGWNFGKSGSGFTAIID